MSLAVWLRNKHNILWIWSGAFFLNPFERVLFWGAMVWVILRIWYLLYFIAQPLVATAPAVAELVLQQLGAAAGANVTDWLPGATTAGGGAAAGGAETAAATPAAATGA